MSGEREHGPERFVPTQGGFVIPADVVALMVAGSWTCALHRDHGSAKPIRGAIHHIWPQGANGPDVAWNRVTICSNGHDAVHAVMWELANGRTPPHCSRTELAMAKRGVLMWTSAGKPGAIRAFMG